MGRLFGTDGARGIANTEISCELAANIGRGLAMILEERNGRRPRVLIGRDTRASGEMLEAARIDGANGWQTLIKVAIPNVMPSITICMFLSLTNGFKLFDQNLALTGGLPYLINPDGSSVHTTEMLALNIYNTFYGQNVNSRGTAQAKAVLFFILVAVIGLFQLTSTRKKEVQQ